jgi:hypothetical protein
MRMLYVLILSCGAALAGAGGGPAVYVIGNLEGVSPGSEGMLVLEDGKAVFRSGKVVTAIPYSDIRDAELGTKVMPPTDIPLYKVWQLHKRFLTERALHQMLTLEFADKDGKQQTMTLELEETAAAETLAEVEIRQGKRAPPRRATNADGWWGDSLWKTPRNDNTVGPETLGKAPTK